MPAPRESPPWGARSAGSCGGASGKPAFSSQFQALAATGIDLGTFLPKLLAEVASPEEIDLSGLRDPLDPTVLPNLLRIGLVPERLVPGVLAQGWRVDRDAKAVEDPHTCGDDAKAIGSVFREQGIDFADPKRVDRASL